MNVNDFINSIYLGDRACKKIIIDAWSNEVRVQVDTISRVRSSDGSWNFYNDENIENGFLVFSKVKKLFFSQNGRIPNDGINYLEAMQNNDGSYLFTLSVDSVEDDGTNEEVLLRFIAYDIFLIDPLKPDVLIKN